MYPPEICDELMREHLRDIDHPEDNAMKNITEYDIIRCHRDGTWTPLCTRPCRPSATALQRLADHFRDPIRCVRLSHGVWQESSVTMPTT